MVAYTISSATLGSAAATAEALNKLGVSTAVRPALCPRYFTGADNGPIPKVEDPNDTEFVMIPSRNVAPIGNVHSWIRSPDNCPFSVMEARYRFTRPPVTVPFCLNPPTVFTVVNPSVVPASSFDR